MFFDILKENTTVSHKINTISLPAARPEKIRMKVSKSVRRMPWLSEAMKDVISCDKLRVGANNLRSGDVRMGQPFLLKAGNLPSDREKLTWRTETS
jgi:hypothetical protein